MSFSTCAGLKTAVASWLARTDLTASIPDFVTLAEARIYYGAEHPLPSQPLRCAALQTQSTGTTTGSITLPTRFLEVIRLKMSDGSNSWTADYRPPASFTDASNSADAPSWYTILNGAILTAGSGSSSYTLDYYQSLAGLSGDADTNWILLNAPGIYLYGTLIEAAPFLVDDNRIATWHAAFRSAISGVNRVSRAHASGLTVRAA